MARILVTGGCGFIGRHVASELISAGHAVTAFDAMIEQVHGGAEARMPPEVTVMRGRVEDVEDYAHGLFAERGIRHGHLSLVPLEDVQQIHQHGRSEPHMHSHLKIKDGF